MSASVMPPRPPPPLPRPAFTGFWYGAAAARACAPRPAPRPILPPRPPPLPLPRPLAATISSNDISSLSIELLSAPLNRVRRSPRPRGASSREVWRWTKFDRPPAGRNNFCLLLSGLSKVGGAAEHLLKFITKSLIYLALAVSLALALSEWSPTPPPPAPHTSKPPGSPAPTSSRPSRVTRTRTTASVRRPRHVKPTCRPRARTSLATAGTTPAALAAARHHHPLKPHRRRQH